MDKTFDVFISYSRNDSKFVNKLASDLEQHQISIWLDTQEIEVGDQFRSKIEDGIDSSRYFCLVLSPSSLKSYYVRKLELEAAFIYMIRNKKETFILPILLKKMPEQLPLMLSSFHYLDFSDPLNYHSLLEKLVKKIKLDTEDFTGARWYKNMDVSPYGILTGVGPLNHISYSGSCVKIHFEKGLGKKVETFTDGEQDGYKVFCFDAENRVYENTLFRNDQPIDTWRYFYDLETKKRIKKQVYIADYPPHLEIDYDEFGNRLEERHLNHKGELNMQKGFARRTFNYENGVLVKETWFDVNGKVIKVLEAT